MSVIEENNFIYLKDLLDIYNSINLIREPKLPFPQADVFDIFVDICEILFENGELSREIIMDIFNLKPRRYSFYKSAGEYLGLITKNKSKSLCLTQVGIGIFAFDDKNKKLSIVHLILQHKPFYDVFSLYVQNKKIPNKTEIFYILKQNNIYNINSDVTLKRRSSTVYNWIKWIINLIEE